MTPDEQARKVKLAATLDEQIAVATALTVVGKRLVDNIAERQTLREELSALTTKLTAASDEMVRLHGDTPAKH